MRKERRGLDRARRVESVRLRELIGRFAETVVKTEEASGGMACSTASEDSAVTASACASLRAFCRRRCGRSSGSDAVDGDRSSFAGSGGNEAVNEVEFDDCPLEITAARGKKTLLRK